MSTAVADPHQRVRRAVADAAATMAAFGGPERAEIGWEEVRAVWAAGPRNGRPTPWDAWAGESERVPLSRKGQPQRVPDFDVIDSIMEPYNLLEDLLTSCDCHNNGEQPKKVGDACGDGYVDEVYGWEYYGGNCWFKYRCRDKDKCRCHSLEEALSAAGVRLSDLDDSTGHGACGAAYPGRVEKPGWAFCGGRNARLVWDAETESCAVELDCFPDQSATDACDVDGSARISLGADALTKCTVGSRTTEYWPIHKGVCADLAVDVWKPSKEIDSLLECGHNVTQELGPRRLLPAGSCGVSQPVLITAVTQKSPGCPAANGTLTEKVDRVPFSQDGETLCPGTGVPASSLKCSVSNGVVTGCKDYHQYLPTIEEVEATRRTGGCVRRTLSGYGTCKVTYEPPF